MNSQFSSGGQQNAIHPSDVAQAKILVVDDDPSVLAIVTTALELAHYKVIQATNGTDAITEACASVPDLIISDYNMPGITGHKLLQVLRQTPYLADIPFILITGETAVAGHRQSMNLGVDDYLPKPFSVADLLGAVKTRLEKARALRERSQRKLDELRLNLSQILPHELNTPLVGICGLTEVLREDFEQYSKTELKEMIELIYESSQRLQRTISSYLSVAELELARHDPARIAVLRSDSTPSAGELAQDHAHYAALRHRRVSDLYCKTVPNLILRMGRNYFARVIDNLVDNACKFSPPGTPIRVNIRLVDPFAEIEIADAGLGMAPEQVAAVGAFVQFGRSYREQQGSGLGLFTVSRLAELHGGSFDLASTPGSGTRATIRLPAVL